MRLDLLTQEPTDHRGSSSRAWAGPCKTISERIAAHAVADPDRPAVADMFSRLSYGELDRRSSQLAALLREAGAGAECCVGLFLERTTDFVVAALAVLKAGAAYLPLDHATPADRASYILGNAGAPLLVTKSGKAASLKDGPWRVIELEDATLSRVAPAEVIPPSPSNLAYVIYTSGSTGTPKGVEITHANLQNLIDWHCAAFGVTNDDRASQIAGLGFDAAVWEIWPYLWAGASVHFADERTRRSAHLLRDWLVAEKITIGFAPTLLAEQLLSVSWPRETSLRTLLTGADTLHRRPYPGLPFTLVNNYGPTECTVVATSGVVAANVASSGPPSIGLPILNTKILIVDDALRPVAPGEPGELCISGAGVARGYRNAPELTAGRFVSHRDSTGQEIRIYRTGDRARLLENGEIAFLGRNDDQVKIRGYRIELGEIISCLDRYPGIESSAVIVKNDGVDGTSDPTLVVYLTKHRDARLTALDLREYLGTRLPDYMIPSLYVTVNDLPLTANGKLDKAALPAPGAENLLPAGTSGCAAETGRESNESVETDSAELVLENEIAEVVAALLGQPSVDHEDNFFLSGGHSMFGVQLVSRLRDTFGVKLTLRQLFNAPTVTALSAEVARMVETSEKKAV